MRYLFTVQTSNDLGLLTRSLPIAAELTRRGHQVVFSNPAAAPSKLIVEAGFENLLLKHPLHYITALQARGELTLPGLYRQIRSGMMHQEFGSPWDLLIRLLGVMPTHFHKPVAEVQSFDHLCAILFLDNERYARGELEAWVQFIEAYQPDGIIDSLNPLACLAARILKKPLVTLLQADMHPGNPGVMWWKQPSADVPSPAPVLSKLAQEHGLPGIQKTEELFLGDLTLILGIPETDPIPPGARGTYIGPVLWQKPGVKLPAQIESLNPDFPLVWLYLGNPRYFSFRTPYDTEATIQTCMEAMADEPVQVVLTTGNHPLLRGCCRWQVTFPGSPLYPVWKCQRAVSC